VSFDSRKLVLYLTKKAKFQTLHKIVKLGDVAIQRRGRPNLYLKVVQRADQAQSKYLLQTPFACPKPALWRFYRDVCTSQLPVLIRAASTPMRRAQNLGINWSNPAVTIVFIIFGAICCRAQKWSFRKGYLRNCASVADGN